MIWHPRSSEEKYSWRFAESVACSCYADLYTLRPPRPDAVIETYAVPACRGPCMLYPTSAARVGAVLRGGCSKGVSARAMPDPIETIRACLASPLPPGYRNPGPRVEHLLAPREDFVSTLVAEGLQLPQVWCAAGKALVGPSPTAFPCPSPHGLPPKPPPHPSGRCGWSDRDRGRVLLPRTACPAWLPGL